ncbi:MAG: endonuclease G [Chlamydiales bacterium]|jgi:endonuclease G
MAPAADHKNSQQAMDETFLLTNVSPQVGIGFNQHYWARIEGMFRKMLTAKPKENLGIHIITGTLFLPNFTDEQGHLFVTYQVIGENNVAVPTHFYKIILIEKYNGSLEGYALLAPNEYIDGKTPISEFATSVSEIERLTGLIFFDQLSREHPPRIDKNLARVLTG